MRRTVMRWLTLVVTIMLVPGCALVRPNVAALTQEHHAYYDMLIKMLESQRITLKTALEEQLKAGLARRRNLLKWRRDLAKAEILLQVDPETTGNRKLLHLILAELDLGFLDEVQALEEVDQSRIDAMLALYDATIDTAKALRTNNDAIYNYLATEDTEFALRSLDIGAIVRVESAIRDIRDELKDIELRSEEERKKDEQRLKENIERTRDVLIKVLGKK